MFPCEGSVRVPVILGRVRACLQPLKQIHFEKVCLLCKDLSSNPCPEMLAGELRSPLRKHFNGKLF